MVEQGANIITGANTNAISDSLTKALKVNSIIFETPLYGNGTSGQQIVDALIQN